MDYEEGYGNYWKKKYYYSYEKTCKILSISSTDEAEDLQECPFSDAGQ